MSYFFQRLVPFDSHIRTKRTRKNLGVTENICPKLYNLTVSNGESKIVS